MAKQFKLVSETYDHKYLRIERGGIQYRIGLGVQYLNRDVIDIVEARTIVTRGSQVYWRIFSLTGKLANDIREFLADKIAAEQDRYNQAKTRAHLRAFEQERKDLDHESI